MTKQEGIYHSLEYGTESFFAFISGLSFQKISGFFSITLENLFLLALASILPNKAGVRTGAMVGIIMAPPMVDAFNGILFTKGLETSLPIFFVKASHFIFSHHMYTFGLIGGIAGTIIFFIAVEDYLFKRLSANLIAGGGAALICFFFTYIFIVLIAITNKYGHPKRFLVCLEILIVCTIVFPLIGAFYGFVQWICEKISKGILNLIRSLS